MGSLTVGGLTPLTTIDFPGRLAAVVFCQGCPWRCKYCHNPELLSRQTNGCLSWQNVVAFLNRRQGLLDGVIFSGGEPSSQKELINAIQTVKDMGFKTGLHTAGPYPSRLKRLLPWLDWVGMDIKAPFSWYERITGVPGSGAKALKSVRLILEDGVSHEFRTTVDACLQKEDVVLQLAQSLASLGVRHYVLQECRSPSGNRPQTRIHRAIAEEIGMLFDTFSVRRAA